MSTRQRRHRSTSRPMSAGRNWRWPVIGAVAAIGLVGLVAGWRSLRPDPRPRVPSTQSAPVVSPPSIASEGVDAAVIDAIRRDEQAVIEQPMSSAPWGTLGMTLLAHEFDSQAAECFLQAEALDGQEARWPYLHARAVLDTDPDRATHLLEQAVRLTHNEPSAVRLTLCELLLQLHRLDEAERHLSAYLSENRGDVRARLAQARLEFMRGDYDVCLQHVQKLVDFVQRRLESRGPMRSLLSLMAEAQTRLGQIQQAEATQRLAATHSDAPWPDPYYVQVTERQTGLKVYLIEADLMFDRGEYDQVIDLLQQTVSDYPDSTWAKIHLARALIRTGAADSKRPDAAARLERAENLLRQVLQLDPRSVEAIFRLGVVKGYQGKFDEAAPLYERAIALKPDFTMAHYNLARCRARLDDPEGAIAAAQAAIDAEPHFVDGRSLLGTLLMREGRFAEAEKHFATAVELQPNQPRLQRLLGEARRRMEEDSP